jgi:hypothetical protein
MLYQRRSFTVPAAGPNVTQEDWDAIFKPKKKLTSKEIEEAYAAAEALKREQEDRLRES